MPDPDKSAAPSLSDAIEKIMANPELLSMAASVLGNMKPPAARTAEYTSSDAPSEENTESGGNGDNGGNGGNAGNGGGNDNNISNGSQASATASAAPNIPNIGDLVTSLTPLLSGANGGNRGGGGKGGSEERNREALLCALKPYVSSGRREAIDYIIRISQISDMLKHIN